MWSSLEGECELRAESDRTGHVTLSVRAQYRQSEVWTVEGSVVLEAGQLDAIAVAAKKFEENGIRTTLSGSSFRGHHLTVFFTEAEGVHGRSEAV